MAKIDSTTSGVAVSGNSDEDSGSLLETLTSAGQTVTRALSDPSSLVPFSREDAYAGFNTALQWATHSDEDVDHAARDLSMNPKQTLAKMSDAEAKWCLGAMKPADQKSVLDGFVQAGLTRRVPSEPAPAKTPQPPALYEVSDKQSPAVKEFLHQKNVDAARDYSANYDAYAERNASDPKLPAKAMLREPGSGAAVYEKKSWSNATSFGDYALGKADDLKQTTAVSNQLARLGVGDEMKMSFGVEGSIKAGGIGLSVDVKAKRAADGYTLSPSASATGSVKLDETLKGAIGVSAGVEFHAETLKDTQRISEGLAKMVTGTLSSEDKEFLKSHVSGYDLKGSVAAKFAPKQKADGLESFYTASAKEELSAHLDIRHHSVTVTTKGQLDGGSAMGLKDSRAMNVTMVTSESRGLSASVSLETKYQFGDKVNDVEGALASIKNGDATTDTSMKIRLEKTGKSGVAAEVSVSGQRNVERALASMRGGVQGLTTELLNNPGAKTKLDVTKTEGDSGDVKVGVDSANIKLTGSQLRVHHEGHDAKLAEVLKRLVAD